MVQFSKYYLVVHKNKIGPISINDTIVIIFRMHSLANKYIYNVTNI